ncbi:hypothetical protein WQ54_26680 [Bacillus sp. SA1-12]|uniref:phosphotransferase family protein n=1 Tax=Bacillus sp. SA1-12 TaxID=1455638 RepID=UPI000626F530|nr:aminoglycoside phosphotransferase family protein [Bacillus sp. SA1-12]KKI89450.1 hypothetical protein WQ54_26680 [Bacillus sp. SA1-12]
MTKLDSNIAKEIASAYLQESINSIDPIVGKGSVNQLFIVRSNNNEIVVRLNHDRRAMIEYEKESWCIDQAIQSGIPSPDVLAVGQYGETPYMILSLVEGEHGENSQIENKYIWRKIGQYTKAFHSIKVSGFGEILADRDSGAFEAPLHENFDGTWLGYIKYNINSLTAEDELIKLGILTIHQSETIKKRFERLLEQPFQFGLTHGDLSLKNTIVNKDGLVSLLDWGSAAVNIVPHWDLILCLQCLIDGKLNAAEFQAFLEGYGITRSQFLSMEKDLHTLILLNAFDKLRWAIDCNPLCIPDFVKRAKIVVGLFLD